MSASPKKKSDSFRKKSLNPLIHEHIPPAALAHLKDYKYSGVDHSILGTLVMQSYWNFVVTLLPLWVAPNVVTLAGFILSTSSTLLLLFFREIDTGLFGGELGRGVPEGSYPPWVWFYAAFALFAYQTLDAIDGKQARRTKSGSPMGELFDHGCDAFFTPLLQVNASIALGVGDGRRFLLCLVGSTGLLFAIWEQFVTGTLEFGYITGPTEGILLICAIFITTGVKGISYWTSASSPIQFDSAQWVNPDALNGARLQIVSMQDAIVWFTVIAGAATVLTNVAHVLTRRCIHPTKWIALTCLGPNALVLLVFLYFRSTYPEILSENHFLAELCYGLLVSYTATRLTVTRLCAMRYRPYSFFYVVVTAIVGGSTVLKLLEVDRVLRVDPVAWNTVLIWSLRGALLAGTAQYMHLIVSVFRQLSHVLHIKVFKISQPPS